MNRPNVVNVAIALYLISIIVSIPALIINAYNAPEDQSKPVILIGGSIFIVLYLAFAWLLYKGKNWARILYGIAGVIGVVSILSEEQIHAHHSSVLYINWFQLGVSLIVVVLLFLPKSTFWFNQVKSNS